MIVVDVPSGSSVQRVAAAGSCRVTQPLWRLYGSDELTWIWAQQSPIHTTADLLQSLDLIRTATRPPAMFESLILEPSDHRYLPGDPAEFMRSIDTFLVEISNYHLLRAGGWSIQVDRLATTVLTDHAEILLPWWGEVCRNGRPADAMVEQVLAQLGEKGVGLSDDLQVLVRDITRTRQDEDDLRADMKALIAAYPGRWIFVSHFAVPGVDSTLMNQRQELSRLLRSAANSLGAEFFDPSELIAVAGRQAALGSDGGDLYHYSHAFAPVMGNALLNLVRHGNAAPAPAKPRPKATRT